MVHQRQLQVVANRCMSIHAPVLTGLRCTRTDECLGESAAIPFQERAGLSVQQRGECPRWS
jgi:hypothetical protein